jgi:major membrane immunogen (membrane-anchored lipoprotein)
LVNCGSAEAIKSYRYPITKDKLEQAVIKVLKSNPHIAVDTTKRKVIVRRHPNDPGDTSTMAINAEDYQGKEREEIIADFAAYTKIKITVGQIENNYEFRYYGDEQEWKNASSSALFITMAQDKYGQTLYQGKNEHGEFKTQLAKNLTSVFEAEFINKLDKELQLKHSSKQNIFQ